MTQIDVLVVELGELRVGLPASVVLQIVAAVTIAPLPSAPGVVEGVINVHGTIVPVLDMRTRFGLERVGLGLDQHFVMAEAGPRRVALRVDRAVSVLSASVESFGPADAIVPGITHVSALVTLPDGVLMVQDLERFLSLAEARVLDEALAEADRRGREAQGAAE